MVLSMDRWVGKVAVVTAANSNVGAAIVEKLVEEGLRVAALARRSKRIEELFEKLKGKKGRLYALEGDMSSELDIVRAFKWTMKNLGAVHILVNNGGIHISEILSDDPSDAFERTLEINVQSLCIANREAVKMMRTSEIDGHIIHINNIVGHMLPTSDPADIYPAAKQAVAAVTETLRLELNNLKSKIKVTSINPGSTITSALDVNISKADLYQQLTTENFLEAEDVVDAVAYVLSTPPHVQIQELTIKPLNEA